jgi:DNA-nicking Smr family endonuclease
VTKKKKEDKSSPFYALKDMRDRMEAEKKDANAKGDAKAKAGAKAGAKANATGNASTRAGAKAKPSDDDEAMSFHRLMSGVAPLPNDKPGRAGADPTRNQRASEIAARARAEAESARDRLSALVTGGIRFEVTDDGRHLEGRRTDTPPEALRKLRRGLLPIDARLDLHGMSAEEAENAVFAFLTKARANRERTVLLIHGKGDHSPGQRAVLRGEIGAWLSQGRASRLVSAFATAREDDGGEGATYVSLT